MAIHLNRRELMKSLVGGVCAYPLGSAIGGRELAFATGATDEFAQGFVNPRGTARPWVFWMWMNGNISKEGITADLEAMKKAGIGGAEIMNLGDGAAGPVRFMTPEWRARFGHAVAEARRLGISIEMNNDDGWNCGGPAITPDNAMQKVVWTETPVRGPSKASLSLVKPPATWNTYHEICVLAFPRLAGEESDSTRQAPTVTLHSESVPYVQLEFAEPFRARALEISASGRPARPASGELQVSADGREFQTVRRFETGWRYPIAGYSSITVGFRATQSRFFRLLLEGADLNDPRSHGVDVRLHAEPRITRWELKGGFNDVREYGADVPLISDGNDGAEAPLPADLCIPQGSVVDLTSRMDTDGHLEWEVPAGDWTILRIGYTPTGQLINSATAEGKGPDCDKLSTAGVRAQFRAVLQELLAQTSPEDAQTFAYAHNDSWESACQNWSADFRGEFQRRRGYDLTGYLPVLAGGRVVESVETSERFLWDFRRTLADLIAENYWEEFWKISQDHRLKFSEEAAGRQQFMYDPVNYLRYGDIPMGEFWVGETQPRPDCKLAASTAHVYGTTLVGGESFTSNLFCGNSSAGMWKSHPFSLKTLGDQAFCTGVNHFSFHRYVHEPWVNKRPGLAWPYVGTNIERTQTWWEPGAAWMGYIARGQHLLQQGRFVADVCVFTGESVPNTLFRPCRNPARLTPAEDSSLSTQQSLTRAGMLPFLPPFGYDFDGCNLDVMSRMTVEQGKLMLPHGMSYRLLTLPPSPQVTPQVLRVVAALAEAGATVVGPKPTRSPSLSGYPACDDEVRRLAGQVWGELDGETRQERTYGKGRVVWGKPAGEVLASLGINRDFDYTSSRSETYLDYIHRSTGDTEIYFVANLQNRYEEAVCTFRVEGKAPELWYPDTGRTMRCGVYEAKDGRTVVPLRFDPCGSVFVIFREPARRDAVVMIARNGGEFPRFASGLGETFQGIEVEAGDNQSLTVTGAVAGKYQLITSGGKFLSASLPPLPAPVQIEGPWEVQFPPDWGAPARVALSQLMSWTEHADDGVKHFSGTATYVKEFEIPAEMVGRGKALYLDLGTVLELASVNLNGLELGVLWKPPFRVEVSGVVRPGKNRLQVKVTNLWPNRLIGDAGLPEAKRVAQTNWNPYHEKSPLLESGLLGPVVLRVLARVLIKL